MRLKRLRHEEAKARMQDKPAEKHVDHVYEALQNIQSYRQATVQSPAELKTKIEELRLEAELKAQRLAKREISAAKNKKKKQRKKFNQKLFDLAGRGSTENIPATNKQIRYLGILKVEFAHGISMSQASKLIADALKKNK